MAFSIIHKIAAILLLLLGEAIAVYSEMDAARAFSSNQSIFVQSFLKSVILFCIGGAFLILGYMIGYRAFKNIWIVTIVSITGILIVEPVLAYVLFNQLPTRGALVGFVLGTLGFIATITL